MAEKKQNTLDLYKKLMSDLRVGRISPVYLLMGEEGYFIDLISEWLAKNILSEEERDFNLITLYGPDITARQVLDEARRVPMMAERQVIIIREAKGMADLEALETYMDKPVSSTVLVICYKGGTIDGRKKIVAKAGAVGTVFVSNAIKTEKELKEFMTGYVKKANKDSKIDEKAARLLIAHLGSDLRKITSALDKLNVSFAPGAPNEITTTIVEQKIGISKDFNVFEFRAAVVERNHVKAFQIVDYYNKNPKSGGLFVAMPILFAYFQNLMQLHYCPKPVSENAIMAQLDFRFPWQAREYSVGLNNFTARKTLEIIAKLREVDARSKGLDNVSTSPEELLKELVAFIVY